MNTKAEFKRSPLEFYLLLFAISIPFWLLGFIDDKGLPLPMNLPISALMFVCPLVTALILVYRENKLDGIYRLFKIVYHHEKLKKKIWYVPSILLMPFIMLLSYTVMLLLSLPIPKLYIPLLQVPIFFILFFISATCEETGWMGYVFEPMQDRWDALKSSIILGTVWAIWHVIPFIQAHNSPKWIVSQCFFTIAARVLIVWIYNNTEKSILLAILFHTMINVSWSLFPNYGSYYNPTITGAITATIAVLVTFMWGSKTLSKLNI